MFRSFSAVIQALMAFWGALYLLPAAIALFALAWVILTGEYK
jgi:hypothetical protein